MRVSFKYSLISDFVFHVLAHMHVNNASNLYSRKYIESFPLSKDSGLLDKVSKIEDYYNDNFERLCIINFLPVYCNNLEALIGALLSYDSFSDEDIQKFIKPFISILEDEFQKYANFWESQNQQLSALKNECEKYISLRLNDYKNVFDYFGKNADVYFSLSLTCNGRGIYSEDSFSAIVPYPSRQEKRADCFFQLFHEYTHQFTDKLLNTNINMTDGSHNVSENLVILADYFIFRRIDEETANTYLNWIAAISGRQDDKIEEADFLNEFHIPSELMCLLNNEIAKIYSSK